MCRFEGYDGEETPVVQTTTLGYPRIGRDRELKRASEAYWAGAQGADALRATGAALRRGPRGAPTAAGIAPLPGNEFSLSDHGPPALPPLRARPPPYSRRRGVGGPG